MKFLINIYKIIFAVILLLPIFAVAQINSNTCSPKGYTVNTVNGVFTDEAKAVINKRALEYFLPSTFNDEPLTVDYLLNPSHFGGIGDTIKVLYQKYFESETVRDYDLIEMLDDASQKVKTQKLLLVAHSQGNFYANSFYDIVAGQPGGLPEKAIGVYGVANPASRVAGEGMWLTSDTDYIG